VWGTASTLATDAFASCLQKESPARGYWAALPYWALGTVGGGRVLVLTRGSDPE
jgi:hypothetical protein